MESVASKAVGAVAVLLLASSVLGFFELQRGALEREELRERCAELASFIDALSTINARTSVRVTFSQEGPGPRLEPTFRGRAYTVELGTGRVLLRQGDIVAVRALVLPIHPWDPSGVAGDGALATSREGLRLLDGHQPVLKTVSGVPFTLERFPLSILGERSFSTFAHS